MGTCRCALGRGREDLPQRWLGLWSRVEGLLPTTLPLLSPSPSPSVWLLLSCSAARWPPQDEFSWLCQSCCHLFALCWSQQSGSASNPEQLGEPLPSLVISLAPLLCCSGSSLGSQTSCHLLSAGQALFSPITPHWNPPGLPRPQPLRSGCRAGHRQGRSQQPALVILCAPHPQPRLSVLFLSPTFYGVPQLTAPRSLLQELQTKRLRLGTGPERARRCPALPAGPMTDRWPGTQAGRASFEPLEPGGLPKRPATAAPLTPGAEISPAPTLGHSLAGSMTLAKPL